ncbi:MAG: ankyrin repeat domain-containing protein [Candidatus Babeliales bacterium]
MAHRVRSSILTLLFTSFHIMRAMEPPKPPDEDFFTHFKKFKEGKVRKGAPSRTPSPEQENPSPLTQHFANFAQGKTKKEVQQEPEPAAEKETALSRHQKEFFRVSTRPRQYVHYEAPPPLKTEAQKRAEVFAMLSAVRQNNMLKVQRLLLQGINPQAMHPRTKNSTLHVAAEGGFDQLLLLLLYQAGIDIDTYNKERYPPIVFGITQEHPFCIGHLLEHRAWVGPDVNKHTALHTAIDNNKLYSLLALLLYCIDPIIPIPAPPEPLAPPLPQLIENINNNNNQVPFDVNNNNNQLPAAANNNNNDQPPAEATVHEDPIAILDSILEALNQSNVPTLRTLCIQKFLETHLTASTLLRQDLLTLLWNGPLVYNIPVDVSEDLAPLMNFATARTFVTSFGPDEQQKIAQILAWHYAKKHLQNITRLLCTATEQGQTPLQMAQALERSAHMQALVDPHLYIRNLNIMLKVIKPLASVLAENPDEQDPLTLFYQLFIYRLKGGAIFFNHKI